MSRINVRNKNLAKLREFKEGMDVEKYLATEFKQILRALENQFVDFNQEEIVFPKEFLPDLYSTYNIAASPGIVPIGSPTRYINSGKITSNVFFPEKAGKYWIDFGVRAQGTIAGAFSAGITAFYSDAVSALALPGRIDAITSRPYISGKTFMDLTPTRGVYFQYTGDPSVVFLTFYCQITKID